MSLSTEPNEPLDERPELKPDPFEEDPKLTTRIKNWFRRLFSRRD